MTSRGLLIVFEGIDRSGKSTQATLLSKRLADGGFPVEKFSFPARHTPTGKLLDEYLSKRRAIKSNEATHLLFSANRWEFSQELRNLLAEGKNLVIDRYAFSGTAYSVGVSNLDFEWCRNADKGLPTPDAVFYLDIKPESTATRAYYGEELYEKLNLQQRVYNTYNRFKEESYWHTLDGGKEANVIHQEIWKMFSDLHENIKKNKTRIEENLWCSPSMKENSPSL